MGGAQRIPVAGIPEQCLIASMGYPMVNHRGRLNPALSLAADAQGLRLQERHSCLLPAVAVAPLAAGLATGAPVAGLHRLHAAGVEHWQRVLSILRTIIRAFRQHIECTTTNPWNTACTHLVSAIVAVLYFPSP